MPVLLVLTATRSHISLGPAFHIKLKVYILSKLSIGLDHVQWFIKPDTFFPFVARLDMSEKGR